MQPPCTRLVRIISPTILPWPWRTLRSHDRQRASSKLSVQKFLNEASGERRPRRTLRHARTIVNAHHVSQARMLSPCACFVRIMSPTVLPRRYARRPRYTLRSHNRQCTSRKLCVHAAALCSPCAHHAPILLPRRCARRPRRTLRSHDYQRA